MSWQSILTRSGHLKSFICPSFLISSDLAWFFSFFLFILFLTSMSLLTTCSLHFFWLHVTCLTAIIMTKTLALSMINLNNMFIVSEKSLTLFLIQAWAELGQVHYNIGYIGVGVGGQVFWIFEIFQSCFAWLEEKLSTRFYCSGVGGLVGCGRLCKLKLRLTPSSWAGIGLSLAIKA